MKTLTKTLPNKQYLLLGFLTLITLLTMLSSAFASSPQSWQKQELKVKGSWSIEQRADGNYIVFDDAFKTRNAPDLKIFVSKNGYSGITGNNATNNATLISKLQSNKGAQSYKIPAHININDYESLIIHCEQYSKLWASTPLK